MNKHPLEQMIKPRLSQHKQRTGAPLSQPMSRSENRMSSLPQAAGNLALQRSLKLRVQPKQRTNPARDSYEQEADRIANSVSRQESVTPSGVQRIGPSASAGVPTTPLLQRSLSGTRGAGQPLPETLRSSMEARLGTDLSTVRLHTDPNAHQLARSLGANAFTSGSDIYFNSERYEPHSRAGHRLLTHELTHVAQQGGQASERVQCDLMMTLPTALGAFEMDMATRTPPANVGMEGHIRFNPDPNGPYSAQIGLVQVVNVTDVGGATTPASGAPMNWANVGTGAESGRNVLGTTGLDGAPPGWFVDAQTAAHPRGSAAGPNYIEQWGVAPPDNEFGWLRSPSDLHPTSLYDNPSSSVDTNFEFETVAKATDTQTVYGALHWGFQIRSAAVLNEYARAFGGESSTFNEALERFRGYYTHEPIVLYFDTDADTPLAGEDAKITGVLDYLRRYPDVQIQIQGFADEQGAAGRNQRLSERRASNVAGIATLMGIDPARITSVTGSGETTAFAAGTAAGQQRANRRVVMTFVRTAVTSIVMP